MFKAAPEEIPAKIPSLFANNFMYLNASLFDTISTLSTYFKSKFLGIIFAPIPCILCFPLYPLLIKGEDKGSIPILVTSFLSFRYLLTPVIVPPVPIPAINISILPFN